MGSFISGFDSGGGQSLYMIQVAGASGAITGFNTLAAAFSCVRNSDGIYAITHNLGFASGLVYGAWAQSMGPTNAISFVFPQGANDVTAQFFSPGGVNVDTNFTFYLAPY